jgi:ATP-dependent DNA ligase
VAFPIRPPIEPMLAKLSNEIPAGEGWLYEPKWDGFRAIVFRDGDKIHIASRNQLPLERYFPELIPVFIESLPQRAVIDGEIIIATPQGLQFDSLQLRLHPAESRVRMLAEKMPSSFVAFDLLAVDKIDFRKKPLVDRRSALESSVKKSKSLLITPQTDDAKKAQKWFDQFEGAGLDGLIAKQSDLQYIAGQRVMVKIKHLRTVDCVVGGYRHAKDGKGIGSLLLGLYDGTTLHYVGHTSSFKAKEKRELLEMLKPLEGGPSFGQGRAPGGLSRWTGTRDPAWTSVKPKLVCEVAFQHMQGDRFRHGATFLRWRPDKAPKECNYDQLAPPKPFSLEKISRL